VVRGAKTRVVVAGLVIVTASALPAAIPGRTGLPVPATSLAATAPGSLDRAVGRLQAAQRDDGGFGTTTGADRSDPATTVWAALALASVGVHPADQPRRGTTALAYLESHADDLTATEDLARLVLVLRAAGRADRDAAKDAQAELSRRQAADGGWPDVASGPARLGPTAFAILALSGDPGETPKAAVARGAGWLKAANDGRGWGTASRTAARPDTTALGLQALLAAEPNEVPLGDAAYALFNDRANADGGFGGADRRRSTAPATATVLQGIRAFGVDPKKFVTVGGTNSTTTISYLRSRQRPDGGFGDTATTARVLPGLNGVAYPLRAVARGSDRANASAPEDERENEARSTPTEGGAAELDGARAGDGGTSGSTTGGTSSGGTSSGGASTASGTGSSSTATPSTGTPGGAAVPAPTTTAATPPATTTTSTAPTPPAGDGQEVGGTVVGASPTAATGAPGVRAGGGDGDGDASSIALGGLALLAVAAGTQIERRRPRRVGP